MIRADKGGEYLCFRMRIDCCLSQWVEEDVVNVTGVEEFSRFVFFIGVVIVRVAA